MKNKKKRSKKNPVIALLLSVVIPGSGQIYGGKVNKGAKIIFASIVIANLNILILPMIALANPNLPLSPEDTNVFWKYWIPRITHDVASFWSIVFWIWVIIDAYIISKKKAK
jgi:TM2 domain-containing membrane protein YozV